MIRLRLIHGLSHSNGIVSATWRNPIVTVEDEAAARFCVDSGFFEIVGDDGTDSQPGEKGVKEPPKESPKDASPNDENAAQQPATPGQGDSEGDSEDDGLENKTVNELRAYAEMTNIDLGKLTKKADIIAAIRKAEAE